jgi:hypothetical protein
LYRSSCISAIARIIVRPSLPSGVRGVEVLGDGDDLAAGGLDPADRVQRLGDVHARQPVELGDDDPGVAALFDAVERLGEDRPVDGFRAAGHVELGLEDLDLQVADHGEGADAARLAARARSAGRRDRRRG